jgi:hypothetical protein
MTFRHDDLSIHVTYRVSIGGMETIGIFYDIKFRDVFFHGLIAEAPLFHETDVRYKKTKVTKLAIGNHDAYPVIEKGFWCEVNPALTQEEVDELATVMLLLYS